MDLNQDFQDAEQIKPRLHIPQMNVDFNVAKWRPAEIADITNDYTYAIDLPNAGDARLGELMAPPLQWDYTDRRMFGKSLNRAQFRKSIENDGLHYLDDLLPHSGHVIACFGRAARGNSMPEVLFARRDVNDFWSYRPPVEKGGCKGSGLPRQKDYQGRVITDLRNADFGPFQEFLGYASIPYAGIHYYPRT